MEKIPFTAAGLEVIKNELAHLKGTERQAVIKPLPRHVNMATYQKTRNIMLRVKNNHSSKVGFPNLKM